METDKFFLKKKTLPLVVKETIPRRCGPGWPRGRRSTVRERIDKKKNMYNTLLHFLRFFAIEAKLLSNYMLACFFVYAGFM